MSHENKGYWDQISKLTAERNELATLLERVLFAWNARDYMSESYDLYVEAADYLKGLRDE
jgi:hypothetical protein